mmetsp:Transcript_39634/g.93661  ORF Transcript_39634/g.93661 Transcript_39634/m.93661 type:complete len:157 (-) Transcript_39634:29-499(-)
MYILGDAIIYEICYMLAFMPAVVLTSKLCPKELESTLFALLAGFQNFGQQVARAAGVSLIGAFGVVTEAPCNWEGLPGLIAMTHIVTPLVLIPLTFLLIPDARISDDILGDSGDVELSAASSSFTSSSFASKDSAASSSVLVSHAPSRDTRPLMCQ